MGFADFMNELDYANIVVTIVALLLAIIIYSYSLGNIYLYSLLAVYFILVFLLKIDGRLPILAALLLLVMTPFFLIRNLENYANYLATLAYFFLVMGVIKQFFEYLRQK